MATASLSFSLSVSLGAEAKDPRVSRTISGVTEIIADVQRTIPENQTTTAPTTLWTDSQHGAATNPLAAPFKGLMLLVDPDSENANVLDLLVEVAVTGHNSTTVHKRVYSVNRNVPLLLGSSIGGHGVSEVGDGTDLFTSAKASNTPNFPRITRVRVCNTNPANASANDLKARLLIFR